MNVVNISRNINFTICLSNGDIDKFPTLKILKGIIKNYSNKKYKKWLKIKYQQIYIFPIWYNNPKKEIYDCAKYIMENNKFDIFEYGIDDEYLCKPGLDSRIMWFVCSDKDYGNILKEIIIANI